MHQNIKDQDIIQAVKSSFSMTEAACKLNISLGALKYRAKKLGIYRPTPTQCGKVNISESRKDYLKRATTPLEDILEGKYPKYVTNLLKRRLFDANIKQRKCEKCGQEEMWCNEKIVLELDHIDGNRTNHKLENLRILCPNCHSQTPTFRFRGRQHKY